MSTQPKVNRDALVPVKMFSPGVIPMGCSVVFTGSYSSDGFALVSLPSTTDAQINGVVFEIAPDDVSVGYILQAGLSNVQVKIGAIGVSSGDKLNVQDNTGVWQKATSTSSNIYYVAMSNALANTLCWASPIASSNLGSSQNLVQVVQASISSDQSTTSSSLVDISGASVTLTTTGNTKLDIKVSFSMSNASALGSNNRIALLVDGVVVKNSAFSSPLLSNFVQGGGIVYLTGIVSAGSHTIKLQWSNTTGTTQCRVVTASTTEHATIVVMEVR